MPMDDKQDKMFLNCFLAVSAHQQVVFEQAQSLEPKAAVDARREIVKPHRVGLDVCGAHTFPA